MIVLLTLPVVSISILQNIQYPTNHKLNGQSQSEKRYINKLHGPWLQLLCNRFPDVMAGSLMMLCHVCQLIAGTVSLNVANLEYKLRK